MEYKRKQNLKWRAFLCTTALTVVMGAGAAGFKFAENSVTDSTYEAYLQEAGNLATTAPQQCIQYYENAIALNPIEGEAYNQLLNFFLWQNNDTEGENSITSSGQAACVFSDTEEQEIRKVLGTGEGRNRSNEEYLKGNTEAYDKFAYELGIAYFYSYNGTGNKAASKKWLQIAADAQPTEELNETNIERAENLYKIAEYYDSLGVRNQAGDSMVSYSDYWLDLVRIVENDAQNGNNVNTLLAYKELVAQIVTNCSNFKSAGITQKQMENQLDTGEELLNSMDIVTGSANAEYEQEMKDNLLVNLASARNIVNSTFNTGNLGNNAQGGEGNAADTAAD